jgi:hypothetical protein
VANQHVVPAGGRWGIRGEGNSRLTSVHDTKQEAVDAARTIAHNQHTELIVHGASGQIQWRDSAGTDPCPPRG